MTKLTAVESTIPRLRDLLTEAGLPQPDQLIDPPDGQNLVWQPDLSAGQLADVNHLLTLARSGMAMTAADYLGVRADLQALRDLRQLGRNAFMNLPANDRDRMTYDALVSVTKILLAILREP